MLLTDHREDNRAWHFNSVIHTFLRLTVINKVFWGLFEGCCSTLLGGAKLRILIPSDCYEKKVNPYALLPELAAIWNHCLIESMWQEQKNDVWFSPMTKAPYTNTKFNNELTKLRLHNYCGRWVGKTTTIQLVWLIRFTVTQNSH